MVFKCFFTRYIILQPCNGGVANPNYDIMVTHPAGLVIGGGLVMVQFLGTLGFFSMEAMGFLGSKSKVLWW